ncbi:hypothetical protein B0H65DRAFT_584292 [Neurospora tetraspora]|uniref:Uncharacterized protein n=1 Tax=Neurospora tetraspora TaxID=94610 RepID=A0AAE0JMU4_9PEZI|nr:hypothetical protein B0H65DRAFT_584292 [Neurospora tetraspora]
MANMLQSWPCYSTFVISHPASCQSWDTRYGAVWARQKNGTLRTSKKGHWLSLSESCSLPALSSRTGCHTLYLQHTTQRALSNSFQFERWVNSSGGSLDRL